MKPAATPSLDSGLIALLADAVADRVAERLAREFKSRAKVHGADHGAKFLDEKAVAKTTGISVRTLQGWRGKGGGPPWTTAGRRVLYAVDGLEAFLGRKSGARERTGVMPVR